MATPELLDEYPLVLTTGARIWSMFHSEHRQIPHLRALHPDPIIQVNPKTCREYGVKQGDWVWVENQRGRCKRCIVETPVVEERVCATDHAWWLPEAPAELDEGLYGMWDLDVGNLIEYKCGKSASAPTTRRCFARYTRSRKGNSRG